MTKRGERYASCSIERKITQELSAIVLSYADSNHYLAGGQDAVGDLRTLTNPRGKLEPFNSLREAEAKLVSLARPMPFCA